jgi:RNA polymerase-binding transcription factor DksA
LANRPRPSQRETLAETCADCDAPIPLARSLAVPHTDLCSDCAADREVIAKLRSRRGY